MEGGGIGKGTSADILDMHLPAKRHAEIAHLPRPGQPAKPVRLYFYPLACACPPGVQ